MATLLLSGHSLSQGGPSPLPSVSEFLLTYLDLQPGQTAWYFDASVDLNSDEKQEVIVYLVGSRWCGSGGCPMLVLMPEGASYRIITRTTITRTPIRVLDASTSGWRNLGVWVSGGGILPGYEAELRFDGTSYPRNPSSVGRADGATPGRVLIPVFESALEGKELSVPPQSIPLALWGKWVVARQLPATTNGCWGEAEAETLLETEIEYSERLFRWKDHSIVNPTVLTQVVTANQFQERNSGQGANSSQVTFRQLGLDANQVTQILIQHQPASITGGTTEIPGDTVLLKDENTLVLSVCGLYFEARRLRSR